LYLSKKKGYVNRALTIFFDGISEREVESAKRMAKSANVSEHKIVRLPDLKEVEEMERNEIFVNFPATYIPLRNMIFYSIAASFAEEVSAAYIIGGHNREDMKIFEDTRGDFFKNLQKTMWSASRILRENRTSILRPLQRMTKAEVISNAIKLGVPLHLTWSCHRSGQEHCWNCEGCNKRAEAFSQAGIMDELQNFHQKSLKSNDLGGKQ
jgi:7-cyano-7-deazaguanine synthase